MWRDCLLLLWLLFVLFPRLPCLWWKRKFPSTAIRITGIINMKTKIFPAGKWNFPCITYFRGVLFQGDNWYSYKITYFLPFLMRIKELIIFSEIILILIYYLLSVHYQIQEQTNKRLSFKPYLSNSSCCNSPQSSFNDSSYHVPPQPPLNNSSYSNPSQPSLNDSSYSKQIPYTIVIIIIIIEIFLLYLKTILI